MLNQVSTKIGDKDLIIETGKIARQANGAVQISYGETVVLVSACSKQKPRENIDFFPLTVDYKENYFIDFNA